MLSSKVDDSGRALLSINVRDPTSSKESQLQGWIDTGFTGELVLPGPQIDSLSLPVGSTARAILADGSEIEVDTHSCELEWFGRWRTVEVVADSGQFPLIGVGLLLGHTLNIDYLARGLTLD